MSTLRRTGWIWLLAPLSTGAFLLGASLLFLPGSYSGPPGPALDSQQVVVPSYPSNGPSPAQARRQGVVLIDNAHNNALDDGALRTLVSKVADRGHTVDYMLRQGLPYWSISEQERLAILTDKLGKADSFAVFTPNFQYSLVELDILKEFVEKGGRLLIVADPGRPHRTNVLSETFGIFFQDGYLYNLAEHDLNYRNIFVRDFREDELTRGLGAIALYTVGDIKSSGVPLAFVDTNTYSSVEARARPFSPIVKSEDGRILAMADLTFLRPLHNSTLDNDRLASNIADFLTGAERKFDLTDFPYFLRDEVAILLGSAGLYETGARMRQVLADARVTSEIRGVEDATKDAVFLGLYQDSLSVTQYLDIAGVQVGDTLRTPFMKGIDAEGTAVLVLHQSNDRRVLIVLADEPQALRRIVDRLAFGTFEDGLATNHLGVYTAP